MQKDQLSTGVQFVDYKQEPLSTDTFDISGAISISTTHVWDVLWYKSVNEIKADELSDEYPNTLFISLDEKYDNVRKIKKCPWYYLMEQSGETGILYSKNGEQRFLLSLWCYMPKFEKIPSFPWHFQVSDDSWNSGIVKLGQKQADIVLPCIQRFVFEEYENGHILTKNQDGIYSFIRIQDKKFIKESSYSFPSFWGTISHDMYLFRDKNNKTQVLRAGSKEIETIAIFDGFYDSEPKDIEFGDKSIRLFYPQNKWVYFLYSLFEDVFSQLSPDSYDVLYAPDENGVIKFTRDAKWWFLRITPGGIQETAVSNSVDMNDKWYKVWFVWRYLSADKLFEKESTVDMPFLNMPGTKKEA